MSNFISAYLSCGRIPLVASLVLSACLLQSIPAGANDVVIPIELPEPQFVGLGLGVFPDYAGSDEKTSAVGPLVRLPLGGNRFAQLLATEFRVSLLDDPNWRFGVAGTVRFGRDPDDIDDPVVSLIHEVDSSVDIGVYGAYIWKDPEDFRKQFGVSVSLKSDVADQGHGGWLSSASASVMYPVALPVTLGAGVLATYADDKYTDAYFGVTAADSVASGLAPFTANAGMRDVGVWGAVIVSFSLKWHVGATVYYSQILGDAKDSPIVSIRGDDGQLMYGTGFLYAW